VEHLILKLLDKDPAERYSDARQVGYILNSMSEAISGEVQSRAFSVERWPALAGRAELLQHLSELWLETKQGRGQVVFIHGESGVGKTRLAQELIYRLDEATVLVGECQKLEKSRAYAPFISALKTYFGTAPAGVVRENVGRVWQDVARFMPKTAEIIAEAIPGSTDIQPGQPAKFSSPESFSLAESIAQVTVKHPWLLILDNLHRADQSSVKLLDYLARHCGQMSLMIIGIYEDSNLGENEFLSTALESLGQQTNCTVLAPESLTADEMRKFLAGIWSSTVPDDWVTILYEQTKGNPFYAKELAQGLVEAGIASRRADEWHFGAVAEVRLPQQVDQAVLQRVHRLSRETQTFLNQAAVLDPVVKFSDLHEVSDLSAWDALESLDVALQQQLLREAPGEKIVRFSHTKMKQVLYQELSSLKRQLLHREAGEALERQHRSEPKKIAASLAYHFLQAGELEKGLSYSIQAAIQAQAIFANQNALYWYTQALDVMDQQGMNHVTQEQRFELLLAREQIYSYLGLRPAQVADLATLQSLAQVLDDPVKQAQVHNRQAIYEYIMGRLTAASTEAQAGLIAARQARSPILEGESLIQLAHLALHLGQFGRARERLHLAQKTLKKTGNRQAEARRLSGEAKNLLGVGTLYKLLHDYPESERYYQQALELNQLAGGWPGRADCLSNLGDLSLTKGDYARAKSYQERALVIQQFIDNRPGEARCFNRLAAVYTALGGYDTSQKYIEQALSLHRAIKDEQGLAGDLHILGAIYRAKGDYKAARDHAGEALGIFQRAKNKIHEATLWLEVALALEGLGQHPKASHAYSQAKFIQAETEDELSTFDARAGLARCLLAEGKADSARQEVALFLKTSSQASSRNDTLGVRARYPIRLHLTAYQVLQAVGNSEEALHILRQGQNLLQKLAATIGDSQLQASFLENVPEHKALMALVTGPHAST
jgi:tetratricopeptide (TPR) repeat protein